MIYPYDYYGHIPGTAAADGHDPKLLVTLRLDDADVIMAFLDRGDP